MRLAVLISDLLHLLLILSCLCPFAAVFVCVMMPSEHAVLLVGGSLIPFAATTAAVVVFDMHLLEHHPWLLKARLLWSCLLLLLPPLVGPLLWWGWGRRWINQSIVDGPSESSRVPSKSLETFPRVEKAELRNPTILLPIENEEEKLQDANTLQVRPVVRKVKATIFEEKSY
jgi:hypothetical protein